MKSSAIREPTSAYDHTIYKTVYEFKTFADYPVIHYLFEHMRWEPNYDDYLAKQASIGEAGQYMSEAPDTPLHHIFVHLMGYESACYALHDYPAEMEALLDLMYQRKLEALELAVQSPAPIIQTPDNTNADFETRSALPALLAAVYEEGLGTLPRQRQAARGAHVRRS